MLDIFAELLKERKPEAKVPVFYLSPLNPFPEVEQFIERCKLIYPIEIFKYSDSSMKPALAQFLADNPLVKLILIGVRRTDPNCEHLDYLQATDDDWPPCMRLHPLLDWDYNSLWGYILDKEVPHCVLYDHGYTSIGDRSNSSPNPLLLEKGQYRPAYELEDQDAERGGRHD